ncbi:MAG: DUF4293 family protein [Chitinophagaceae bacterium]|nr:DUF4293 family protein [Chitinophagaceae bacterium]
MIQRIQTLWLLIASALAFTTLKTSFFSGNFMVDNSKQFRHFTAMDNTLLTVLTIVVALAALVAVFLYKDRKLQMRVVSAAMVLSILNLVYYYFQTRDFVPADWAFDLTALIALAVPFFLFLATRGIYRDNKIMKSLDRLR